MRTIPGTKIENLNSKVEAARIDCTAGTSKFESFGPQKILWFQTWAKFRVNSSTVYQNLGIRYSCVLKYRQHFGPKHARASKIEVYKRGSCSQNRAVQDRSCMEQGTQYRSSTDPSSKWHRFRLIRWIRPRDFAVDLSMPNTVDYALWVLLTNIFVLRVDTSWRKLPGRDAE
jgi:hypothetical protein